MEVFSQVDHRRLVRVVSRIVGTEDAEDVCQQAYLKAHKAMATGLFRGEAQVFTWVYRIAHRCAIDMLRRRACRPIETMLSNDLLGPPSTAEGVELRQEITALLLKVPPHERQALLAVAKHDSQKEAAEELGISVGALKSRVRRARERMRQ